MSKSMKPLQKRVTIKDIAVMANVSIGTVDRVLHNRGEVNQATHDRIMAFIEELGYTPNLLAKSLALKKNFNILALIPDAGENNPYWKMPLAGLYKAIDELKDYNTKISVYNYDPGDEQSFVIELERVFDRHPDGLILAPNFHEVALKIISKYKLYNIPVVLINHNLDDGSGLAFFGQDARQSGLVAAKLMHFGLARGARVLILNLARNKAITRHMQHREQGFRSYLNNEMAEWGIGILSVEIDISQQNEPSATLERILSDTSSFAGIFVTNSRVHKVARFLSDKGKGNLMLIGYDLIDDNAAFLQDGMIDYLICQKPEDQGYKAAMAIFNHLLTGRQVEKVNYSPIDILVKENMEHYKQANNT